MTNRVSKTISDETLNRIIQIESAGKPTAHAGTSSAEGLGQFIRGTWLQELKIHRPDLFNGPPYDDEMALEKDPKLQLELLARFTEDNARAIGSTRDGDLYLAHFLGSAGAKSVVAANQQTSAAAVCGPGPAGANRTIFYRRDSSGRYSLPVSCADLRAWAAASMQKRWDSAGQKDWVGIWSGARLPPPPDASPVTAPEPRVEPTPKPKIRPETKAAGGLVSTGVVIGGVAHQSGFDWTVVIGVGAAFAAIAVAIFFIVRSARR